MRKQIFSATRMRWSPIPTQPNGATACQSPPVSIHLHFVRRTKQATSVKSWVLSVTGTSGTLEAPTINCPGISEPTSDCSITSNSTTITLTGGHPGGAVVKGEDATNPGELFSVSSTSAGDDTSPGSWSHTFAVSDGANRFTLVSQKDGEISPPATLTVALDAAAQSTSAKRSCRGHWLKSGHRHRYHDEDVVGMCIRIGQNPNCDTIPNLLNPQAFAVRRTACAWR